MTLIVITGEIDLSVASMLGLTCAVMGQLWVCGVTSLPLLIVLCLLLGAVLGAVNGLFVTGFGLPSLAVTIGTLALYRGLAYVVLGDRAVAELPGRLDPRRDQPRSPARPSRGSSSSSLALAVVFGVVLHATPIGRGLYAMGNNAEAATLRRHQRRAGPSSGCSSSPARCPRWPGCSGRCASPAPAPTTAPAWSWRWWPPCCSAASPSSAAGAGWSACSPPSLLLGVLRNALQLADVPANTLTIVTGALLIVSVVGPNVVGMAARNGCAGGDRTAPTVASP